MQWWLSSWWGSGVVVVVVTVSFACCGGGLHERVVEERWSLPHLHWRFLTIAVAVQVMLSLSSGLRRVVRMVVLTITMCAGYSG